MGGQVALKARVHRSFDEKYFEEGEVGIFGRSSDSMSRRSGRDSAVGGMVGGAGGCGEGRGD